MMLKRKGDVKIKCFILFDLAQAEADNKYMSHSKRNDAGALKEKTRRFCKHAGLLTLTLGLTASVVASPTVTRGIVAAPHAAAKHHWFQIGKASWYGGSFNGRKTATGEKFNMDALTCAHRTLPLGSWIRVTNLRNQKSAFLRVNDRGPMSPSLIVDLSLGAAKRLGIAGLAKVSIERVESDDPVMLSELAEQLPELASPVVVERIGN